MDWYYPVLAGVLPTSQARTRLRGRWQEFVAEDWGARCVADEPWVTVAKTCELAMALVRAGQLAQAADLLAWVQRFRDGDGAFWTGGRTADGIVWPEEKPTWTSAAVIMAAAALGRNPAVSQVFG